jgi:hypothetical protein
MSDEYSAPSTLAIGSGDRYVELQWVGVGAEGDEEGVDMGKGFVYCFLNYKSLINLTSLCHSRKDVSGQQYK